jgi:hypothetical protein
MPEINHRTPATIRGGLMRTRGNKRSTKNERSRRATGQYPVTAVRLSPQLPATIDDWAKRQEDEPPRSKGIRRLIELSLMAPASELKGKRNERS